MHRRKVLTSPILFCKSDTPGDAMNHTIGSCIHHLCSLCIVLRYLFPERLGKCSPSFFVCGSGARADERVDFPWLFSSWRKLHASLSTVTDFPLPFAGAPVSILSYLASTFSGSDLLIQTSLHHGLQFLATQLRSVSLFSILFEQSQYNFVLIRPTCAHLIRPFRKIVRRYLMDS